MFLTLVWYVLGWPVDEENEDHLKQALLNRRESVSISHIPSADALLSFIHGMNLSFQSIRLKSLMNYQI